MTSQRQLVWICSQKQKDLFIFTSDVNGEGKFLQYVQLNDDQVQKYTKLGDEDKNWDKTSDTMSNYQSTAPNRVLINYLDDYTDFKNVGSDTLDDGTKVTKYNLTVDAKDLLNAIFNYLGEDDPLTPTFLGITQKQYDNCLDDFVLTYYIDTDMNKVRQIDFDLKDVVSNLISLAVSGEQLNLIDPNSIEQMDASIVINHFGDENITIPSEVSGTN